MSNMQFVVIGLGRFGTSVAQTLYSIGNDVLVIDKNEDVVLEIADNVTHAVQMDATDENALKTLGLSNFDVAVVTIGGNIQASIMATLLVKELGVKYIVAKGNNDLQAKVLYRIGADKVILPEKDMGVRVAHNLMSANILDYVDLSSDYSIIEIKALDEWVGKSLADLDVRKEYGINIISIKKPDNSTISPNANSIIERSDVLVSIGTAKDLLRFEYKFKNK